LLDELDALMQRMLALPVNHLGEGVGPPESKPDADAPQNVEAMRDAGAPEILAMPGTPLHQDVKAEEEPPGAEGGVSAGPGDENGPPPFLEVAAGSPAGQSFDEEGAPIEAVREGANSANPVETAWERPIPASPEVLEAIGQRPLREVVDRKRDLGTLRRTDNESAQRAVATTIPKAEAPAWLRPLLWSNRTFDWCTGLLGGPGRWLRGVRGRALLGWVGLGLIAGGLVWMAVTELGWKW
jgi:hypothetical protein